MSLSTYQRELAAMVADPRHSQAIESGAAPALHDASLSARECQRLQKFSADRGMRVNTALYRANRLSPVYNVLPQTCDRLEAELPELLHAFWRSTELDDLQFASEATRFASFLGRRAADLAHVPGIQSLIQFELALHDLSLMPRRAIREAARLPERVGVLHPLVRVVRFPVDPEAVFSGAACEPEPQAVLIDRREEPGRMTVRSSYCAGVLERFVTPQPLGTPGWSVLQTRGLLVAPPAGSTDRPGP